MNNKNISKIVSVVLLLTTIITFFVIVIMYIMGKYSLDLLFEDTFFVFLTLISISLLSRLERDLKLKLPEILKIQIYIFLFALMMVGNVYNVITSTLWFDKVLHLMSGMFVTWIGILFAKKWNPDGNVKTFGYIGFLYSATVALLWEIVEFLGDIFMSLVFPLYPVKLQTFHITESIWILPQPHGLADTMIDVTLGVLGAFMFMVYYRRSRNVTEEQSEL